MTLTSTALLGWLALLGCLVAGCGGGTVDPASNPPTTASAPSGSITSAAGSEGAIDGRFDVGGHRLYLKCRGTGAPTVVYLHGSINERSVIPHANAESILSALSDRYRVCLYDRRNLGSSDTVDAVQRPADAIRDLNRLLATAKVKPPYVLLGASFGGLLAYLYANTSPDDVVGMVLLDSMFPDELKLEPLLEPKNRYAAYDVEDEKSLERISHYKTLKAAENYIGREPAIPVTYLASIPEGFDQSEYGPEYNTKISAAQRAYVARFAPGNLRRVPAPHFMEPAIPDTIVKELLAVIAAAG